MASRAAGARLRVEVGLGEVGDEERPAGEPDELHRAGEHPEDHARGGECTAQAEDPRKEYRDRHEPDRGQHEAVPKRDEPVAARGEAAQHLVGGGAQDVGIVEDRSQGDEDRGEGNGDGDQEPAGQAQR